MSANSLVALDAEFLTAVVQSQLQQGDREAALATLDRLNAVPAGMSEGAWLISLRCAQLYRDAGDSERARKSWSQAFDRVRNPGQLDALLAGSIKKGVLPDTERLLAYAEGRFAGNPLMLAPVAHARYTLPFEETVRLCRTALEMGAVNARTLLVLGRALSRQGLAEEAAQVIASLRDLEPQNPRALEALIPLHFKLNNWDAAQWDARELVRSAPTSPWVTISLPQPLSERVSGRTRWSMRDALSRLIPVAKRFAAKWGNSPDPLLRALAHGDSRPHSLTVAAYAARTNFGSAKILYLTAPNRAKSAPSWKYSNFDARNFGGSCPTVQDIGHRCRNMPIRNTRSGFFRGPSYCNLPTTRNRTAKTARGPSGPSAHRKRAIFGPGDQSEGGTELGWRGNRD